MISIIIIISLIIYLWVNQLRIEIVRFLELESATIKNSNKQSIIDVILGRFSELGSAAIKNSKHYNQQSNLTLN